MKPLVKIVVVRMYKFKNDVPLIRSHSACLLLGNPRARELVARFPQILYKIAKKF